MSTSQRSAHSARIKDLVKSNLTNLPDFPNPASQRQSSIKKRSASSINSNKNNNKPQNSAPKSRNCFGLVGQSNLTVGLRNTVRPSETTNTGKNGNHRCDVAFIRQLLVINKKQELLLNKKLAELLRDEIEIPPHERKLRNINVEELYSSSTVSVSDPDFEKPRLVMNINNLSRDGGSLKPRNRVEYDLNGRRVYHDRDEDDNDSVSVCADTPDGGQENQIEMFSRNSQTWFNTTTLIQAKSDMSCNLGAVTAQRKSLTLVNQQSVCNLKPRGRCLSLCSGRGGYNRRGSNPTDIDTVFCNRAVHGDGVQNVIAHCYEVDVNKTGSKRRIQKVWNYHDIPKMLSDGSASEGGKTVDSFGETGAKSTKRNTSNKLKSTIPPVRNNRPVHSENHESFNVSLD